MQQVNECLHDDLKTKQVHDFISGIWCHQHSSGANVFLHSPKTLLRVGHNWASVDNHKTLVWQLLSLLNLFHHPQYITAGSLLWLF